MDPSRLGCRRHSSLRYGGRTRLRRGPRALTVVESTQVGLLLRDLRPRTPMQPSPVAAAPLVPGRRWHVGADHCHYAAAQGHGLVDEHGLSLWLPLAPCDGCYPGMGALKTLYLAGALSWKTRPPRRPCRESSQCLLRDGAGSCRAVMLRAQDRSDGAHESTKMMVQYAETGVLHRSSQLGLAGKFRNDRMGGTCFRA